MERITELYKKLVFSDMNELLPGLSINSIVPISNEESQILIAYASMLAVSDSYDDISRCYEIVTRLAEILGDEDSHLLTSVDILLSRIGNFPGRQLLRNRYSYNHKFMASKNFSLERIARETENSIARYNGDEQTLTDFQFKLFNSVIGGESFSVSAPTSAGKSFILDIALEHILSTGSEQSIVYVVPTRALISEVSSRIRATLRKSSLRSVVIRTAPFPIERDLSKTGIVYVLTQERLNSLLYSDQPGLWITSLIIDEAHEIQKGKRGIILQNSIDAVLVRFPRIPVLFASPLISNPEYFINLFKFDANSKSYVEKVSPVSQNIILVEKVKGATNKARFTVLLKEKNYELGERELNFKYRGNKSQLKSMLAQHVTAADDSTILFCNGPGEAESVAAELSAILKDTVSYDGLEEFIEFIRSEIHSEYPLIDCLKKGVAFHYGYMPSILRNAVERLFKEEKLQYMCSTSTLLQGVNLPAKNIIIDNPMSGDEAMSRADFLNLSGRAGRLVREFHGNIWCINPSEWAAPVYEGEQLEKISSAMNDMMKDGGKIVHDLLGGSLSDNKDKEGAEAAFSHIFHDLTRNGKQAVIARYESEENSENLKKTIKYCESLETTLPMSILEAHKSLRPDHLQILYDKIKSSNLIEDLEPIHPFKVGSKNRFEDILMIVSECFDWPVHKNYLPLLSFICYEWVRGSSLKDILDNRINYIKDKCVKSGKEVDVSKIIRSVLEIIERDIRFKLEKYFSAYIDVLKFFIMENNAESKNITIDPYHIYLEFGASDKVSLNLMALGLSRFTALKLSKLKVFKEIETDRVDSYIAVLTSFARSNPRLPEICKREILEII